MCNDSITVELSARSVLNEPLKAYAYIYVISRSFAAAKFATTSVTHHNPQCPYGG